MLRAWTILLFPIKNITNKQKLIEYIEKYPYSQDLVNALDMDVTILQKNAQTIKQAIIAEINKYDPSINISGNI